METASWVIRNKSSKGVMFETFNRDIVWKLNYDKYEAVPILAYLQEINRNIRNAG